MAVDGILFQRRIAMFGGFVVHEYCWQKNSASRRPHQPRSLTTSSSSPPCSAVYDLAVFWMFSFIDKTTCLSVPPKMDEKFGFFRKSQRWSVSSALFL